MDANFQAEKDLGYQQIIGLVAATALAIPNGCLLVTIIPEGANVRWRSDGVVPTAAVGYPLYAGAEVSYTAAQMAAAKFIQMAATATLNIYYWG